MQQEIHLSTQTDHAHHHHNLSLLTPLHTLQMDPLLEVTLDSLYQALLVLFSYALHLYLQATIQ